MVALTSGGSLRSWEGLPFPFPGLWGLVLRAVWHAPSGWGLQVNSLRTVLVPLFPQGVQRGAGACCFLEVPGTRRGHGFQRAGCATAPLQFAAEVLWSDCSGLVPLRFFVGESCAIVSSYCPLLYGNTFSLFVCEHLEVIVSVSFPHDSKSSLLLTDRLCDVQLRSEHQCNCFYPVLLLALMNLTDWYFC